MNAESTIPKHPFRDCMTFFPVEASAASFLCFMPVMLSAVRWLHIIEWKIFHIRKTCSFQQLGEFLLHEKVEHFRLNLMNSVTEAAALPQNKQRIFVALKSFQSPVEFQYIEARTSTSLFRPKVGLLVCCIVYVVALRLMLNKHRPSRPQPSETHSDVKQSFDLLAVTKSWKLKHVSQCFVLQDDTGVYGHCQNDRNVSCRRGWMSRELNEARVCVCELVDLCQHR